MFNLLLLVFNICYNFIVPPMPYIKGDGFLYDYFRLYQIILETIRDKYPDSGQQLIIHLSDDPYIVQLRTSIPDAKLISEILCVLDNLIDDGFVNARRTVSKDLTLYVIDGITTSGQKFLTESENLSFSKTFKKFLKENGLPLSPQSVSKFIAQVIFR